MSERVTQLLAAIRDGDPSAESELIELVYDDLRSIARRQMARERPGHTLQPTALVHEAIQRLDCSELVNRRHLFASACRAMRRILAEVARRKLRPKHGGDRRRLPLDDLPLEPPPEEVLSLDEALDRLEIKHPEKIDVVLLRFFGGFSVSETANALGFSKSKIEKDWSFAKAWLHADISRD